ncbi:MAG TPA: 2-oxo acid dehydrogenase subunit E2, partial [Comamonadaceae bacterium]|nr:2-oxo acid dehydrogenase subunit E2 [Comamonadaceae bacterium]
GVIYPPQVAIVGFGRLALRPWVVGGTVMARPVLNVSLAADHRVTDGHLGGQLLAAIGQALLQPQNL